MASAIRSQRPHSSDRRLIRSLSNYPAKNIPTIEHLRQDSLDEEPDDDTPAPKIRSPGSIDSSISYTKSSSISIDIHRLKSSIGFNYYQRRNEHNRFWHRVLDRSKYVYHRFGLKHSIPVLLLALYSLLGAGIFYSLESSQEIARLRENQRRIEEIRRQMIERIWEIKLENISRRKATIYSSEALTWYDENVREFYSTDERQWDFWGAIFYCGTIYTTIGYGNIFPRTFGGKLVTLFYAAFGIPLVFFILNDLGDVLGRIIYKIWTKTKKLFQRDKKSNNAQSLEDRLSLATTTAEFANVHDLPMSVALGLTLGWMFLCSAVFCSWEDWDYFQAFHFFFVSLTTVGLGDTVPRHHNYMIMSFGLILLGLSLVSMCIQVVQAKVEYLAQQILEKLMRRYYQTAQLERGELDEDDLGGANGDNPTDLIERTLDQEMAPQWIRALLTKKKKAKLMKEWRKRTKVRVVGTQTDWHGGRRVQNTQTQTDVEPDWKMVYEKKLTTAQDLLKELEQRYGALARDQKSKWSRNSIRKSSSSLSARPMIVEAADETISAIKSAISRVPSKRMTSLKERFRMRRRSSQSIDSMGLETASVVLPDLQSEAQAIDEIDQDLAELAEASNLIAESIAEKAIIDQTDHIEFDATEKESIRAGMVPKRSAIQKWKRAIDLIRRRFSLVGKFDRRRSRSDRDQSHRSVIKSRHSEDQYRLGIGSDQPMESPADPEQPSVHSDHLQGSISAADQPSLLDSIYSERSSGPIFIDFDQRSNSSIDSDQRSDLTVSYFQRSLDRVPIEVHRVDQSDKSIQVEEPGSIEESAPDQSTVQTGLNSHEGTDQPHQIALIDQADQTDRVNTTDQTWQTDRIASSIKADQTDRIPTIDRFLQTDRTPMIDRANQTSKRSVDRHAGSRFPIGLVDQNQNNRFIDQCQQTELTPLIDSSVSIDHSSRLIRRSLEPEPPIDRPKSLAPSSIEPPNLNPKSITLDPYRFKEKSIVIVEESVEENRFENRSAIRRWIRRFAPKTMQLIKKYQSIASQTDRSITADFRCPVCNNPRDRYPTVWPAIPTVIDACTSVSESIDQSHDRLIEVEEEEQATPISINDAGVQCNVVDQPELLTRTRFVRIPYQLDDCKMMFGVIRKRLDECQSILNQHGEEG